MSCPKCGSDNREGIKFCEECGAKLELECPACKSKIPPGKKFCGECGTRLALSTEPVSEQISFDEKLTTIQKYLPEGLTEKILSQRDRIEGERKQVTVMFCDMEGYTSLSERLGIEEAYALMDQVYEILIHKVHDYGGTVNEMTGDGIMALFGAPIAMEDAPQRAIHSGLAIQREMAKFNDRISSATKDIPRFRMRVGIHTGPVVVGTLGNDLRVEFKAVGDTVNTASRMEELAEPGAICVSEETFRFTEGLFQFEAVGEKKVKGKAAPVKIFRVLGMSQEEIENKFGFMLRAFKYGAPPHGGIAPGLDRLLQVMCHEETIREVIAFPKAKNLNCPMMQAPSGVSESQLEELNISVKK